MLPPEWPSELRTYLRETWGDPGGVTRLSGAGGPGAYRVSGQRGEVIVKCDARGREALFYQQAAPALRRQSVPIPELFWAGKQNGMHWMVLELLPAPLPRDRWVGDPQVMEALARLHVARLEKELEGLPLFRLAWTAEMTEAAVSCVPAQHRSAVRAVLLDVMEQSQGLFAPVCFISGDPNPTNWGLRSDGSVALFDWERFGCGSPAIDVAITMPGLPTEDGELERRVAAAYLTVRDRIVGTRAGAEAVHLGAEVWAGGKPSVDGIMIRRAKLWTVVEFLSQYAAGELPESVRSTAEWLRAWLPEVPRLTWAE